MRKSSEGKVFLLPLMQSHGAHRQSPYLHGWITLSICWLIRNSREKKLLSNPTSFVKSSLPTPVDFSFIEFIVFSTFSLFWNRLSLVYTWEDEILVIGDNKYSYLLLSIYIMLGSDLRALHVLTHWVLTSLICSRWRCYCSPFHFNFYFFYFFRKLRYRQVQYWPKSRNR